jgi:hypothetical protein
VKPKKKYVKSEYVKTEIGESGSCLFCEGVYGMLERGGAEMGHGTIIPVYYFSTEEAMRNGGLRRAESVIRYKDKISTAA